MYFLHPGIFIIMSLKLPQFVMPFINTLAQGNSATFPFFATSDLIGKELIDIR